MRLSVRNWLIRGLILAGVAALIACGWVANSWISPERIREQVIAALGEQLDGVEVQIGSAHMRILGGIAVRDLRLVRRGHPDDPPFFFAPSAVLYHDKEQLNRGRLVIRKIGLENPDLRLEREQNGQWNVEAILRPGPADHPVPTFVAKGATLVIVDRAPGGIPELRFNDAQFTLLNDPLPILTMTADATVQGFGAVQVRARFNRISKHTSIGLEMPEFPLGEVLPLAVERFAPGLLANVGRLTASASVKADLTYAPEAAPAWRHDVRLEIKDGKLEHPELPWPVEKLAMKLRSVDGKLRLEGATAKIGTAQVQLSLETRGPASQLTAKRIESPKTTADVDQLERLEEHLQKLEVVVANVPLDDTLFRRLGEKAARAKAMFSPNGSITLGYKFLREAAGGRREIEVRPHSVSVIYEKFKYPVTEVQGSVKKTMAPGEPPHITVDLRGKAAGQPITLNGKVVGDGPDPAIDLRLAGINLPLDDSLIAALPGKYPELIREFHAAGRADLTAKLVQQAGVNLCENEFRVEVHDARMNYSEFPYPIEKVKGTIVVRATATDPKRPPRPGEPIPPPGDQDELILDGFTGEHAGASLSLSGGKRAVPGSNDRKLMLHIAGNGCPADADLKAALGALKLNDIWTAFSPRGTLTFSSDLEILDRGPLPGHPDVDPPFNAAADLKLTFHLISGLTITPSFFAYEISDLSGSLKYQNGRVDLAHFAGRHGSSQLKMLAGDVRFYPDGAIWANLGGMELKPLTVDAALLKAFPGKLRSALEQLQIKGSADLNLKHLVVLTPPQAAPGVIARPPDPYPIAPMSHLGPRVQPFVARGQQPAAFPLPPPPLPKPDPIVYWNAEVKFNGASLDTGVPWEDVFGAAACRGRYEGTHLGLLNGHIKLDRALIAKQPVTNAQARLFAEAQVRDPNVPGKFFPTALQFAGITGQLFHGMVGGEARVLLGEPVCYELWLTANDVKLEDVAKHHSLASDADLKGVAQAQLRLFNRPDPKTGRWGIEGIGKIDVPTGRMYNLPVMLDLVKVLKLSTPDRTAFEEAHATFHVHGDRIKVDQLDLIGKALCVGGSGELDSSGDYARFEFYTLYSEILARLVNTPVGDVSAFLSRGLFKIKMVRDNGVTRYKPEPVPVVTEPIKAMTDRLKSRIGRLMGK